ncbi:MAG TPA: hypothetical protein PKE57_02960, partial [Cellvibrionaceae bacterium]|nr:hypothetical protein [Cellvibrionaceae bacterium]
QYAPLVAQRSGGQQTPALLGLSRAQIEQAVEWAKSGYFSALKNTFNEWEAQLGADNAHIISLKTLLHAMQFNRIIEYLSDYL